MPGGPIDSNVFRDVCAHFVTGVCVVTSFGPEGPSGLTANAFSSLSLDPPLVLVCFDRSARTLGAVERSRRFAVQFLTRPQEETAARFASKQAEAEKFSCVDWSERSGVPVLEGCLAGLACELQGLLPGGDHLIALGRVVDLWRSGGQPLVFFRGDYGTLAKYKRAPRDVDEALEGP